MDDSSKKAKQQGRPSESLHSLLVPIDLTATSDRVLGRLALLPLADRAMVTLLHVVPGSLHPREQRNAERDARQALEDEARHLAKSLAKSIRLRSVVRVGGAARHIADAAQAQAADLILLGRGGGRTLRDSFLGSTAERVMRIARRTVLAVRLAPRAAYHRPALAIDLDRSAPRAFTWLLRMLTTPRPPVEVIHAFDSPYERMVYPSLPEDAAEEHRAELRHEASTQLAEALTRALVGTELSAKDASWTLHVRYGSPRSVVAKAVKQGNIDLLALGTHGYSGLAHAFLGSVAGDLLRTVGCDVLVVPPIGHRGAPR